MPTIDTVGIFSKPLAPAAITLVPQIVDWLVERGIRLRYDESTAEYLNRQDGLPREEVPDGADLIIVLGGDGTLLSAARAVAGRATPSRSTWAASDF